MDREIEARFNQLESQIMKLEKLIEMQNVDREIEALEETLNDEGFYELIINYPATYKKYFEKKYCEASFWEEDYPTEFYDFDFKKLLKQSKGCRTRLDKLHFWVKCQRNLKITLNGYGHSHFWNELIVFMNQAIKYYRTSLLEYILEEGKHLDKGGRKPDIDSDIVINLWNSYKADPDLIHKNGRYKNQPKRKIIYNKIANEIGVSKHLTDRTQTIRQIIKNYEIE